MFLIYVLPRQKLDGETPKFSKLFPFPHLPSSQNIKNTDSTLHRVLLNGAIFLSICNKKINPFEKFE